MRKYWTIVGHTFSKYTGNKSFFISTVISIVFIVELINADVMMSWFKGNDGQQEVAVIDDSGLELYEALHEALAVQHQNVALEPFTGTATEAIASVKEGEVGAFLHLEASQNGLPEGTFHVAESDAFELARHIEQALQTVKETVALEKLGVSPEVRKSVSEPVTFQTQTYDEANGMSEEAREQTRWLVYALLFVLYLGILTYGNMIALEVATEKSSRVMELLVSSVSPVTQMFGKITGIALLGLFQFGLIGGAGAVSVWYRLQKDSESEWSGVIGALGLERVPVSTIVYVVVFFLLGYLLYATLSATLGCLVSRSEDVNQAITPVIYLLITAFFISMFGLSSPDSPFITAMSFIPFFTPMIMFLRVGMTEVPAWEVGLSLLFLIGFIVACAVFGARVYRGGVMLYGKYSSWKDIRKAFVMSQDT